MNESVNNPESLPAEAFFSIVNSEILIWDAFQEALQTAGSPVSVARFIPLHFLASGPMRLQELAKHTHTKESAMSRLVERMVGDGLVFKRLDDRDRRAIILQITSEGRRIEADGRAVFARCLDGLFSEFGDSELRTLKSLLGRIAKPETEPDA